MAGPDSPPEGLEPAGPAAQPPAALLLSAEGPCCLRLGAEHGFHRRLDLHRAYATLPCLVLVRWPAAALLPPPPPLMLPLRRITRHH